MHGSRRRFRVTTAPITGNCSISTVSIPARTPWAAVQIPFLAPILRPMLRLFFPPNHHPLVLSNLPHVPRASTTSSTGAARLRPLLGASSLLNLVPLRQLRGKKTTLKQQPPKKIKIACIHIVYMEQTSCPGGLYASDLSYHSIWVLLGTLPTFPLRTIFFLLFSLSLILPCPPCRHILSSTHPHVLFLGLFLLTSLFVESQWDFFVSFIVFLYTSNVKSGYRDNNEKKG